MLRADGDERVLRKKTLLLLLLLLKLATSRVPEGATTSLLPPAADLRATKTRRSVCIKCFNKCFNWEAIREIYNLWKLTLLKKYV